MRPNQRKIFLRNHPEHADWCDAYEAVIKDYNETFKRGEKDDQLLANGTIDHAEFVKRCKAICKLQNKLYEKMNDLTDKILAIW